MKINFKGFSANIKPMLYHNERTICLYLVDENTNPVLTVTALPVGFTVPWGSIPVKNYSENKGIYQAMRKHEIIDRYTHSVQQGHVDILICPMRPRLKRYCFDQLAEVYVDSYLSSGQLAELCGLDPEQL